MDEDFKFITFYNAVENNDYETILRHSRIYFNSPEKCDDITEVEFLLLANNIKLLFLKVWVVLHAIKSI